MRRPRSSNDPSCVGRMRLLEVRCYGVLHLNKQELGLFCVERDLIHLDKSSSEPASQ